MQTLAQVYYFLSLVFERVPQEDIRAVALYSVSDSGASVFIDVWNPKRAADIEKQAKEQLVAFADRAGRIWGQAAAIDVSAGNIDSAKWSGVRGLLSSSAVLYGRGERMPEAVQRCAIMMFSLSKLRQQEKMRLIRGLYGYETEKAGKKYRQAGLLAGCGGAKLSSNSILVPAGKTADIRKLFSRFGIAPQVREIWSA